MNPLLMPWLAELVLITYRSVNQKGTEVRPLGPLPVPADYAASFVVFGALSFVPGEQLGKLAVMFGWGVVLATFLNLWDPTTGKLATPAQRNQPGFAGGIA